MSEQILFLIRGCPGAGKSTLAKLIAPVVLEADQYFMQNGVYEFNPRLLDKAHKHCQERTQSYMQIGYKIAVSNTFTEEWEMQPYFDLAKQYNYKVFTIVVENRHGSENIHNCPEEVIEKMKGRFEIVL